MTDPQALITALLSAGWELVGERAGLYKRLAVVVPGGAQQHALMIPLDPSYGDYQDLMDGVLSYLNRLHADGVRAGKVLAAIKPEVSA